MIPLSSKCCLVTRTFVLPHDIRHVGQEDNLASLSSFVAHLRMFGVRGVMLPVSRDLSQECLYNPQRCE